MYQYQLKSRDVLCSNIMCHEKLCLWSSRVQNSDIKREHTRSGSRVRCLRRSIETLTNHEEDEVKAKDHLELNLARDVKGNKKDFYRHMDSRRKTRENVRCLLNGAKGLETKDTEKAEILSAFFALVFTGAIYLQECQVLETVGMSGARTYLPSVEEDQVKEHIRHTD